MLQDSQERKNEVLEFDEETGKTIRRRVSNKTSLQILFEHGTIDHKELAAGERLARNFEVAFSRMGAKTMNYSSIRVQSSPKPDQATERQIAAWEYVEAALKDKKKTCWEAEALVQICCQDKTIKEVSMGNRDAVGFWKINTKHALEREVKRLQEARDLENLMKKRDLGMHKIPVDNRCNVK